MQEKELDKSKSFNHPTFGKIVGYNSKEVAELELTKLRNKILGK